MEIMYLLKDKNGIKYYTHDVKTAMHWKDRGYFHLEREIMPVRKITQEEYNKKD